jgi:hypothetical protein
MDENGKVGERTGLSWEGGDSQKKLKKEREEDYNMT